MSRFVGRLETLLGLYSDAEELLAYSKARHEEWGAAVYLARTWANQAEQVQLGGQTCEGT